MEISKPISIVNKKIINTKNFDDLLNARLESKKPIYYIVNDDSYEFILKNKKEIYIYILKK